MFYSNFVKIKPQESNFGLKSAYKKLTKIKRYPDLPTLISFDMLPLETCLIFRPKWPHIWTASSEFATYRLCEQRRFRRACASAQSRQNLHCSLIQAVNQEEPSDRKPDPWPLWMAVHAQLKFVVTECSKTQICLTRPIYILYLVSTNNNPAFWLQAAICA